MPNHARAPRLVPYTVHYHTLSNTGCALSSTHQHQNKLEPKAFTAADAALGCGSTDPAGVDRFGAGVDPAGAGAGIDGVVATITGCLGGVETGTAIFAGRVPPAPAAAFFNFCSYLLMDNYKYRINSGVDEVRKTFVQVSQVTH